MIRVAVFASGSGTNFENLVKSNLCHGKICLLIVDKENAYAIHRSNELGIPYIYVNPKAFSSKVTFEEEILNYLKQYQIQLIALAGYMRFIGDTLLQAYPKRIINLHPAYLPAFPGANSIYDAFIAKAEYSGVTVHFVDEGIDTGEIIYQEKVMIDKQWDITMLEQMIHKKEYELFPMILDKVCEEVEYETSIT